MVETSTKSKNRAPMRITASSILILCLLGSVARAEQIAMQLEWGLGPTPSEMYWDGQVRVMNGRLISMKAVSFEPDRHDQMRPPEFKSFTVNNGTDGMELVVDGNDSTTVGLVSLQGNFEWKIADLRKKLEVSFPGKDKGRLVVRLLQSLGDVPSLLSDRSTQDSDPAMCRLADGRHLILWRAFLGLPSSEPADKSAPAGDQIRGVLLDREGNPGQIFDVLSKPGDVDVIAVAPAKDGGCRIVWAELRQKNWDLYYSTAKISSDGLECEAPEQLTDEPGVDKTPAVATTPDGALALVWQGWRGTDSNIFFRQLQNDEWTEPICLSDDQANDWNPAIAASAVGSIAVAWPRWQSGSYDICLRVREGGQWGPVELVAATDRFEAHPSVVYDDRGTLWFAYEEGRAGWGMDSHTAGLRSERNVRVSCRRNGQLQVPRGTTALALPEALRDRSEMATLSTDGNGTLWLFFRSLTGRGVWNLYGTSLGDDGWLAPQKVHQSAGGQNVGMAAGPDANGRLRIAWSSDHRLNAVGLDNYVYASLMPQRARRSRPVEVATASDPEASNATVQRGKRPTFAFGDKQLGLYFGDLHRHTELSVCRTGADGSLEDAYRYAIDAAELDFLCVTDHVQHVKLLNDYDYWRSGKTADLHRVTGLHQPFHGYERSQRFPYGHRNIIGFRRDVKRVPRTADNRPWSANQGYEGEQRVTPPELWTRLVGQNVITIPHTSTSPVMGTDFGHRPAPMQTFSLFRRQFLRCQRRRPLVSCFSGALPRCGGCGRGPSAPIECGLAIGLDLEIDAGSGAL